MPQKGDPVKKHPHPLYALPISVKIETFSGITNKALTVATIVNHSFMYPDNVALSTILKERLGIGPW